MSTLDLEPIKERLAAATPGPWDADGTEVSQHWSRPEPWLTIATNEVDCMAYCYGGRGRGVERVEDAEFIAHAPEDIRALLAEVKRLQAQIDAVKELHKPVTANVTAFDGTVIERITCECCLGGSTDHIYRPDQVPTFPCGTCRVLGGEQG